MDAIRAIRVQGEVFHELNPEHEDSRIVAFIGLYGGVIRVIINTFPQETGRDPTKDDIIWRLGEVMNIDPRVVIRELVCQELVVQDHENN